MLFSHISAAHLGRNSATFVSEAKSMDIWPTFLGCWFFPFIFTICWNFIISFWQDNMCISAILSLGGKLVLNDRFGKSLPLILMPGNFAIFCFNICPFNWFVLVVFANLCFLTFKENIKFDHLCYCFSSFFFFQIGNSNSIITS